MGTRTRRNECNSLGDHVSLVFLMCVCVCAEYVKVPLKTFLRNRVKESFGVDKGVRIRPPVVYQGRFIRSEGQGDFRPRPGKVRVVRLIRKTGVHLRFYLNPGKKGRKSVPRESGG